MLDVDGVVVNGERARVAFEQISASGQKLPDTSFKASFSNASLEGQT
jgi:hypothetical protein